VVRATAGEAGQAGAAPPDPQVAIAGRRAVPDRRARHDRRARDAAVNDLIQTDSVADHRAPVASPAIAMIRALTRPSALENRTMVRPRSRFKPSDGRPRDRRRNPRESRAHGRRRAVLCVTSARCPPPNPKRPCRWYRSTRFRGCLAGCRDELVRQPYSALKPGEHAILEPGQAAAVGATQRGTETILERRGHVVVARALWCWIGRRSSKCRHRTGPVLPGCRTTGAIARLEDGLTESAGALIV